MTWIVVLLLLLLLLLDLSLLQQAVYLLLYSYAVVLIDYGILECICLIWMLDVMLDCNNMYNVGSDVSRRRKTQRPHHSSRSSGFKVGFAK